MKILPRGILCAVMSTFFWLNPGFATAAELTVQLENPPLSGAVVLVLFSSANTFGDFRDPARLETYAPSEANRYVMRDIPAGEYALMVYHDENKNLEIDRSFIGIPTEPLGFSNGYRPKGPPSYSRAAFNLEEDEKVEFSIGLYRPLGKRGRLGVGVGANTKLSEGSSSRAGAHDDDGGGGGGGVGAVYNTIIMCIMIRRHRGLG